MSRCLLLIGLMSVMASAIETTHMEKLLNCFLFSDCPNGYRCCSLASCCPTKGFYCCPFLECCSFNGGKSIPAIRSIRRTKMRV
uniref:Cysteine rich secreted protein n=1 Tax=Riptortus pedestris TaxID=329032 RepID=R4WQN6_RIPPE|nr:cysteine rich secreted protein [Riptortus pedestris]